VYVCVVLGGVTPPQPQEDVDGFRVARVSRREQPGQRPF
jgi:hypothetical protein